MYMLYLSGNFVSMYTHQAGCIDESVLTLIFMHLL